MNELVLVKKIETKLQRPQEVKVFPLTPTHRKELRQLRDENIGALKQRLRTIKELKKQEYIKKYEKDIAKELKKYKEIAEALNNDWNKIVKTIKLLINSRKSQEFNMKDSIQNLKLSSDYGDFTNLNVDNKSFKREYSFNMEQLTTKIATEEFEKKFGLSFQKSQEHIDRLYTMYEEAINFGDLEIVKEIYYKLKNADSFFIKVAELKIN